MGVVIAIDAGTTGVRSLAVDEAGTPLAWAYREITQHYPRPGWVEHDPDEIWDAAAATLAEVSAEVDSLSLRSGHAGRVAAIGITNQRETVVAWDRRDGRPRAPAIVWQDRRTADQCEALRAAGHEPSVREATGLVIDPYFSATKIAWLLGAGGVAADAGLALGTVDAWLVWKLTGGAVHATDPSNASRTLLYDIRAGRWSGDLVGRFDLPPTVMRALPDVLPSSGRFGVTRAGVPVSGVAGDQQAALFGQACFEPGMAKNTYGTGAFLLVNAGTSCPPPADGLLTTVAWQLGEGAPLTYALEGAVFVTGETLQWLRDGLGIVADVGEAAALAASVRDSQGVVLVPAFTGLGSPWWDPRARGTLVGLTKGVGRAHLARAAVEAMAYQTRDVVDAIAAATGRPPPWLRVDGGASVMDLLLQIQADQLQVPVARPTVTETTAMGSAWLAGLAEGVWGGTDELARQWQLDAEFTPSAPASVADSRHATWRRAVDRARAFAATSGPVHQ